MGQPRSLTIVSLYPRDMNIYGDRGNLLALTRRARAHGFDPTVIEVNPGDPLPAEFDILIGGGGQDSGQLRVAKDLMSRGAEIRTHVGNGVPMLLVCGLYQLFGNRFTATSGDMMRGIGVFDAETLAGAERMIGNIIVQSDEFGEIIGFENHSGYTTLGDGAVPLGRVTQGAGNNPDDGVEGARAVNAIGTYMHGALLPKNPAIIDFLIAQAASNKYGTFEPKPLIDKTADRARASAKTRPR